MGSKEAVGISWSGECAERAIYRHPEAGGMKTAVVDFSYLTLLLDPVELLSSAHSLLSYVCKNEDHFVVVLDGMVLAGQPQDEVPGL